MTLLVKVGRRVPKNWFKRQASKIGGLISFQENIWLMINQSMNLAKKKCNLSEKGTWVQTKDKESEDMHYDIEWLNIVIRGNKDFEKEEYEEALDMYKSFGSIFKKDMPKDKMLSKVFKTKVLSQDKVEKAYKEGYGSIKDNNLANKLLEMGILTHVELIDDYEGREIDLNF